MSSLRDFLERHQVFIYFGAVLLAAALAMSAPNGLPWPAGGLEAWINPALACMLYLTFFQVPMAELKRAFTHGRFLMALLLANFAAIPLLVAGLLPLFPAEPLLRLGMLMVLLCPCIDYVVTFAQMGRADARLLLAATPALLLLQMLLLPLYLPLFLTPKATQGISAAPFLHAFVWLIAVPLALAALTQFLLASRPHGKPRPRRAALTALLGLLPVPATAWVLFVVVAAVLPQLTQALPIVRQILPVYLLFALSAPLLGWLIARQWRLPPAQARALAFSAATRNSLVILPLVLAIPGAPPWLAAVVLSQTLIELLAELAYIRLLPLFPRRTRTQDKPA
ncbi:arsenic resistance protein [Kerstersia sp.]|uniref:arsenic resistance protein n=1 Tax=Kerstersia sp. TaxID=1930783 RepID=UPI003F8EF6A1